MKSYLNILKLIMVVFIALLFGSCQYQEISEAVYPEPKVYLPAAASEYYLLNDTNQWVSGMIPGTSVPALFKYQLDIEHNKVIVPIGVYRSGTDNQGVVNVEIVLDNTNVVQVLENSQTLPKADETIELLAETAIAFDENVVIADGTSSTIVNVEIDIDYLATKKDKLLAWGMRIVNSNFEIAKDLDQAIIVIDTDFIVPYPKFSYSIDKKNDRKITFYNETSGYAKSFVWQFDDTELQTVDRVITHEFDSYKEHSVSFTAIGITGKPITTTFDLYVWQNVTSDYLKNPGNPFLRSDDRTAVVGNLANWLITDNLKTTESKGEFYGGYVKSQKYGDIVLENFMDFFSMEAIEDGKIYQSFTLPAGDYRAVFMPYGFTGSNECYFVVSEGNNIPDADTMNEEPSVLASLFFDEELKEEQEIFFSNPVEQTVTIGFVVNTQVPLIELGIYNEVMVQYVGVYK